MWTAGAESSVVQKSGVPAILKTLFLGKKAFDEDLHNAAQKIGVRVEKQATSSWITVLARFKVDCDAEVNHNLSELQMGILGTQQGSSESEWLGNCGWFCT